LVTALFPILRTYFVVVMITGRVAGTCFVPTRSVGFPSDVKIMTSLRSPLATGVFLF